MPKMLCHSDKSCCPIANALDLLGDRWTLLIVRDMIFGNIHEYKDLLAAFEGISTNILSDRLCRLMAAGIIKSTAHPESKTRKFYYLTSSGKNLIYPLIEIAKWARHNLDGVELPAGFQKYAKNPERFIKEVMDELENWEKKFLKRSAA